jgi:hypothetical protein
VGLREAVHQGSHLWSYHRAIEAELAEFIKDGKRLSWTQIEYRNALYGEMNKLHIELKAGNIKLNKNARSWAKELENEK